MFGRVTLVVLSLVTTFLIIAFVTTPSYYSPDQHHFQSNNKGMDTQQDYLSFSTQDLGNLYQQLRSVPGHLQVNTGAFNSDVDGFNGKKHLIMKALQQKLGAPGAASQNIVSVMGQPDEITLSLDPNNKLGDITLMPGPIMVVPVGAESEAESFYMIYYWRGRHDYLWFKVDTVSQAVKESNWYMALE